MCVLRFFFVPVQLILLALLDQTSPLPGQGRHPATTHILVFFCFSKLVCCELVRCSKCFFFLWAFRPWICLCLSPLLLTSQSPPSSREEPACRRASHRKRSAIYQRLRKYLGEQSDGAPLVRPFNSAPQLMATRQCRFSHRTQFLEVVARLRVFLVHVHKQPARIEYAVRGIRSVRRV